MDEDGDTALTHVVFDQPEHPMYERHLKRVLRNMCTAPFGAPLTSLPVPTLQRFSYMEAQAGQQKVRKAKKLVTKRWLEKILLHVGEALVATDQRDLLLDTDRVSPSNPSTGRVLILNCCTPRPLSPSAQSDTDHTGGR